MRPTLLASLLLLSASTAFADPLADLAAQRAALMGGGAPAAAGADSGSGSSLPTAAPTIGSAPTEVMQSDPATAAAEMSSTGARPIEEPIDPNQYRTGRGDVLQLNFWGKQNLTLHVTIDPEGRLFVPKIGYTALSGKTLAEARTLLQAAVRRYYPGLSFDLSLESPRTFLVHVIENVAKPGVYPANPLMRVGALVGKAGVQGSRRHIEIRHRDGRIVTADLVKYEVTGDRAFNPFLEDGDTVRIPPEGACVNLSGPVWRPGRYELVDSNDFADLLALAGGLKAGVTYKLPVRVHRRGANEHVSEISFPWRKDGEPPSFALKAEDLVTIPGIEELQRSVQLIGALGAVKPVSATETDAILNMQFVEGDTVRRLIERAGGLSADADLNAAYVTRDGNQIALDLEALLIRRDFGKDMAVRLGDSIILPRKRRSIMVEGSVFRPGVYEFKPGFNVAEYVNLAGGAGRDARPSSSYDLITARGKTIKHAIGLIPGPGDTIVVPERSFSRADTVHLLISAAAVVVSTVSVAVIAVKVSN